MFRSTTIFTVLSLSILNLLWAQGKFDDGSWYKLKVEQEAIYKLDYEFIEGMGLDPSFIDPRKIKVYGDDGSMLEQVIHDQADDSFQEMAIQVVGEEDGKFDTQDYVLFYGKGAGKLVYDEDIGVQYHKHLYAKSNYYFITFEGASGKRVQTDFTIINNEAANCNIRKLTAYEEDELNIVRSGRNWLGEVIDDQVYSFEMGSELSSGSLQLQISAASRMQSPVSIDMYLWDQFIGTQQFDAIPSGTYDTKADWRLDTFNIEISQSLLSQHNFTLDIQLKNNQGADVYLDYLVLDFHQSKTTTLNAVNFDPLFISFFVDGEQFSIDWQQIDQSAVKSLWAVNDFHHAVAWPIFEQNGQNLINYEVNGAVNLVYFDHDAPQPESVEKISHQWTNVNPELLIITHSSLLSEANRLAQHREQYSGLAVQVLTTEQIFDEFGGGKQDVTAIRNAIKYYYNRFEGFKYALLFGSASFNYYSAENLVPTYQSRNSYHPIRSYCSDDYYGFLEVGEGYWEESTNGDHTLDIGVGRLPALSLYEAKAMVDKIIHYETSPATYGAWRNKIVFVADDEDNNLHVDDAELLSSNVDANYPQYLPQKIYLDAFPQISSGSGQSSFDTELALSDAIHNGALIVNFTGHGNPQLWTEERILEVEDIATWNNYDRLPLFITATCAFGRYDDHQLRSGAEQMLIHDGGGAIALVTASRYVYASSNLLLNKALYEQVFERDQGQHMRLGEIIRRTKNNSLNGFTNRNFTLLGDPSMMLAYPKNQINITTIQAGEDSTLAALDLVKISGEVLNDKGVRQSDFNGVLNAKIFDKGLTQYTLGNGSSPKAYEVQQNYLYQGDVSVVNGQFSFSFIISKSIQYQLDQGKISLYALAEDQSVDAGGGSRSIWVGGSNENSALNNDPPVISLYLDSYQFKSGDKTGQNPVLLAKIADENGINTIDNGVMRGIVAILDGEEDFLLNAYFNYNLDSYTEGVVHYPFTDLSPGWHELTLTARDTQLNKSEQTIRFFVVSGNEIVFENVINFPNPVKDYTQFSFKHNKSSQDLEIIIDIYSIKGEWIQRLSTFVANSPPYIDNIIWDKQNSSKKWRSGVYLYRLFVRSNDNVQNQITKKFVIIE